MERANLLSRLIQFFHAKLPGLSPKIFSWQQNFGKQRVLSSGSQPRGPFLGSPLAEYLGGGVITQLALRTSFEHREVVRIKAIDFREIPGSGNNFFVRFPAVRARFHENE